MAGGLLDLNDPSDGWNIDPATLAQMASAAGTPTWTPGDASSGDAPADATIAATDAQPAPAVPAAPPATMADTGGGFWHSLASGIGDAGLALGGGIDPSITGDAASIAGRRALLNFGLTMLANSGPSYTPRNFGQILASGLSAANQSTIQTEQTHLKAQQLAATYALKAGQMRIQEYLAGMKGTKEGQEIAAKSNVSKLAAGGAGAPAAGTTPAPDGTATAPAASAGDFVSSNAPVFQDVAARTGFPVDFVAGQAGNESGWGTSRAATQGNNLFGLSDADGKPLSFPTRQAGIDAYVNLLNSRYKDVPRTGSNTDIGTALGKAGYNMTVPDYGARVGAAADQARRLLPQPTTTAPATTAAAPGTTMVASTGATVPTSGVAAPTPSSAPPSSLAATVFGPGSPGWQTLPPAVLPDVAARKAEIEDTYQRDKAVAAASGNDTLLQKANQDRQASLSALNNKVTELQTAHQKAETDLNATMLEKQQQIAAENARNTATIQGHKDVETQKAQAASDLQRQTELGSINTARLKPYQEAADQGRGTLSTLDMLDVFAPAIMQGGRDPVAQTHPELRAYLGLIDPGNPDSDKWNAQDIWTKLNANLARADVQSFKGRTSNNDLALVTSAQQTLGNDPAMIPIVSGLKRALALRHIQENSLAHDYVAMPTPPPGGLDQYINSQLPGYDPKHPLTPPPLFNQPPPLHMAVVASQPNWTDDQMAAAKAADDPIQSKYVQSQPVGVPFMTWSTIQGPQGDRYVQAWMVKSPDGSVHQQKFPAYQRAK